MGISILGNQQDRKIFMKEWFWLSLCLLVLIPPTLLNSVQSGLDPSWEIAVNLAVVNKLSFGEAFIFTFGPLGFLSTKNPIGASKWIMLCYEGFIFFCMLYALRHLLRPVCYKLSYCLVALLVVYLISDRNCDTMMVFSYLFFSLLFLTTQQEKSWPLLLPVMLLSALSLYIKVNYGIVMIGLFYVVLALGFWKKTLSVYIIIGFALVHTLIVAGLAFLFHVSLFDYLYSSLQVINAYNDAMFLPVKFYEPLPALSLMMIGLYGFGFLMGYKNYLKSFVSLYGYLFGALFFYLIFKNGYVRADGHMDIFFNNIIIVFAIAFIFSETKDKKVWGSTVLLVLFISYSVLITNPLNDLKNIIDKESAVSRLNVGQYFTDIVTDISYKNTLADSSRTSYRVYPEYAKRIGTHSVDIIPTEISELYYYGLNYTGRPVSQSYAAYNEFLDGKNAEKLNSGTGPDFILYTNESIDNRFPFWDESITKRALMTHYELAVKDTMLEVNARFNEAAYLAMYPDVRNAVEKGQRKSGYEHFRDFGREECRQGVFPGTNLYLLFKKRETPLQQEVVKESAKTIAIGEELQLEKTSTLQYLYAEVNYTLYGKLRRFLFQPPMLTVHIRYEDGTTQKYRAIVPILKTGVLINKKLDTAHEAIRFFISDGKQTPNISSIRFEAGNGIEKTMNIKLREIIFK